MHILRCGGRSSNIPSENLHIDSYVYLLTKIGATVFPSSSNLRHLCMLNKTCIKIFATYEPYRILIITDDNTDI